MSIQRCCPPVKVHRADYQTPAELLQCLADPHRLAILATLARAPDEVCVCDFTDGLPLNQPTVSHHLRVLRNAGLVVSRRHGTWVYYSLSREARARMAAVLDLIMPEKARK